MKMTKVIYGEFRGWGGAEVENDKVFYHSDVKTKKSLIAYCINQMRYKNVVKKAVLADGRVYNIHYTRNMNVVAVLEK